MRDQATPGRGDYGVHGFLTAWTTVTRVPVPFRFEVRNRALAIHLVVIGFVVAGVAAVPMVVIARLDATLAAFVTIAVQYLLFNLFHFDGLLDTADALLCYAPRERRFEILKDPRIGVFACFTGVICVGLKIHLLRSTWGLLDGNGSGIAAAAAVALFAYPVTGRAAAAVVPAIVRPATPSGLGAALSDYCRGAVIAGLLVAFAGPSLISVAAGGVGFAQPVMAAVVGAMGATALAVLAAGGGTALAFWRRIGGFTGDALGAAVELGELVHLGVLSVVLRAWSLG